MPAHRPPQRSMRIIDAVGRRFETAYPKELSGGMKQRVGRRPAPSSRDASLFMDEPFSALGRPHRGNPRGELLELWAATKFHAGGGWGARTMFFIGHSQYRRSRRLADVLSFSEPTTPAHIKADFKKLDVSRHPRDRKGAHFLELVDFD